VSLPYCAQISHERRQNRLEDVLWLVEQGYSIAGICGRSGLPPTPGALYRFLVRHGHGEVARRLGLAKRMYDYDPDRAAPRRRASRFTTRNEAAI
jgi:hypothetical protein